MNLFKHFRLLALILLTVAISLTISLVLVQQNINQKTQTINIPTKATVQELTSDVVKETAIYSNASPAKKGDVKIALIESVKERNEAMEKLVENDPEQFLKVAVSDMIANLVPPEVKKDMESPIRATGQLEIYHIDMENGSSEFQYFLQDKSTKYELHPTKELSEFTSGETVQVTGVRLNNDIVIDSSSKGSIQKKSNVLAAATIGEQKVAVLLVNFQDDTSRPITAISTSNITFNNMNSYFREVSYNKAFLSGNVFGYYTLPMSLRTSPICNVDQISNLAFEAAKNDITYSQYNRFIFVLPDTAGVCGWAGLSGVGSFFYPTPQGSVEASKSWVKAPYYSGTTPIHELGHAFGLLHSNGWNCGSVSQAISGCNTIEYGNRFTVMGGGQGHYTSFHKEKLGWLSPSNIQTVTTPSTFNIAPIETATTAIQAVKIPARKNIDSSIRDYYYLENRQPIGYDSNLHPDVYNGILIDWAVLGGSGDSQLINATPDGTGAFGPLLVGKTFQDNVNGINLTTVSKNASSVTVSFSTSTTPICIQGTPTLSITPASAQGISGAKLTYSINITNNNSAACPPMVYSFLTTSWPPGFTTEFSQNSISLASGASGGLSTFITSVITSPNGIYSFTTSVKDSTGTIITSASNSYIVFNPVTTPTPTGILPTATPTTLPPTPSSTPTPTPIPPTPTRTVLPTPTSIPPTLTPTPRPVTTDLQAPTISITSPLNGSTVAINSTVTIKADASDDVGVSYVYFYVDGTSKCFDRTSPYECNWDVGGTPNIRYTLSAQAYDASGKNKNALSDVTARISIPTATPIPPAPTNTPTPTPIPPTRPLTCDPNKDGIINTIDFEWWKDEYLGVRTTKISDCFKPDGVVDLLDFQIWKDIAVTKIKLPF